MALVSLCIGLCCFRKSKKNKKESAWENAATATNPNNFTNGSQRTLSHNGGGGHQPSNMEMNSLLPQQHNGGQPQQQQQTQQQQQPIRYSYDKHIIYIAHLRLPLRK